MANVYKPKLIQVRPQYSPNPETGEQPQNILWFEATTVGTPSVADLQAVATVFDTQWWQTWRVVGYSSKDYLGSIITDWSSNTGVEYSSVGTFIPGPGSKAGQNGIQVAALVKYNVGLRWRGGHFRTYLPWIGADALDATDVTVTDGVITAFATAFNTMFSDMQAVSVHGGYTMKMYKNKNNPGTAELLDIVTFNLEKTLATQRRRLRRVTRK